MRKQIANGIDLSASRGMKQLELVSKQSLSHVDKKIDQPHLAMPSRLGREFDV